MVTIARGTLGNLCEQRLRVQKQRAGECGFLFNMTPEGIGRQVQPLPWHLHEDFDRSALPTQKQWKPDHSFAADGGNLDRVAGVTHRDHRSHPRHWEDNLLEPPSAWLYHLSHSKGLQFEIGNDAFEGGARQRSKNAIGLGGAEA